MYFTFIWAVFPLCCKKGIELVIRPRVSFLIWRPENTYIFHVGGVVDAAAVD